MPISVHVNFDRGLRLVEFAGSIRPDELDEIAKLYFDTRFYRFEHAELAIFAPDATLIEISAFDLGELADIYAAALRERTDAVPSRSAWVVHEGIVNEARMWRQFAREDPAVARERHHVSDLAAALEVLDLPAELAEQVTHHIGFTRYPGTRGAGQT